MKCPRCNNEMNQVIDYGEQGWMCPFCGKIIVCILDKSVAEASKSK